MSEAHSSFFTRSNTTGEGNMDWLWQGLLTNWLAHLGISFLPVLGILAVLLVFLKLKAPAWADPIWYGLGAFTFLVVSLYALKAMDTLPPKVPQITFDNVEVTVKTWLEHFGLGIQKTSTADAIFTYKITLKNGTPVVIARTKELDNYITLQANLEVSPEHRVLLEKMKNEQITQLIHEVILELARSKIEGWLVLPLQNVVLSRRVPITSNLTEDTFMERLQDIHFALNAARETIV
jgi:hypothetical protein